MMTSSVISANHPNPHRNTSITWKVPNPIFSTASWNVKVLSRDETDEAKETAVDAEEVEVLGAFGAPLVGPCWGSMWGKGCCGY